MRKVVWSALLLGLCPNLSEALEIKNVRPTFGPYGALRTDTKVLPGDTVFLSYDVEGLSVDKKTNKVNFLTTLELVDANEKSLYKKETPTEMVLQLGGDRVPGDLYINTGPKQPPGKYTIRLTILDRSAKQSKAFTYPFELLKEDFGFAGIVAPGIGLPGQNYTAQFALINIALDAKKQPKVDVAMSVKDESGNIVALPVFVNLPKDLPEDIDLQKVNFVPLTYPIYLNRPGRFTVEITAVDYNANKKRVDLRYTLTVIDLASAAGK